MLNNITSKAKHYSDDQRKLIEEKKARWRAVNYGETDSNLAKYQRQVDSYGRIRFW